MTAQLTVTDLAEIEELAEGDAGEHCRGALLALVGEVRRLRANSGPVAVSGDLHQQGGDHVNREFRYQRVRASQEST